MPVREIVIFYKFASKCPHYLLVSILFYAYLGIFLRTIGVNFESLFVKIDPLSCLKSRCPLACSSQGLQQGPLVSTQKAALPVRRYRKYRQEVGGFIGWGDHDVELSEKLLHYTAKLLDLIIITCHDDIFISMMTDCPSLATMQKV